MSSPSIQFSSRDECDAFDSNLKNAIRESCKQIFIDDNFEYGHASYQGLTSRQQNALMMYVKSCLNDVFPDSTPWCYKTGENIATDVGSMLDTLVETGWWRVIYDISTKQGIFDLVMHHSFRILDDILLGYVYEYSDEEDDEIRPDDIIG